MKKITISIVSVLALSSLVFAGGEIKEVEPGLYPVGETTEANESSLYVGLAYSYMNMDYEIKADADLYGDAVTLLSGYQFNKYIAVEGRYSKTVGDLTREYAGSKQDIDGDMSNIALYLKPMYPMGGLTLYGLLGYGKVTLESSGTEVSESGFQWGLGASYAVTEKVGVFLDYTRLYDDNGFGGDAPDTDFVIDAINVGIAYSF